MTTAQSAQPGFAQRTLLPAPPGHGLPITQLNEQDPPSGPGSLTQPRPPQNAQGDKISLFPPQQTTLPPHQRPQKLILSPVSSHPIHPEGPWGPPPPHKPGRAAGAGPSTCSRPSVAPQPSITPRPAQPGLPANTRAPGVASARPPAAAQPRARSAHPPSWPWAPCWPGGSGKGPPAPPRTGL